MNEKISMLHLRKLAQMKGQEYAEIEYANGVVQVGIHKYGCKGWWFHAWSNEIYSPRTVAFAALSTLPDAKGTKR